MAFNLLSNLVLYKRIKAMKTEEQRHPSHLINYKELKFKVSEPEVGSIAIEFEDIRQQITYATKKNLEQVSYKTVVSALMQSEPQILTISLIPLVGKQYEMKVRVKLEYLHQIQEKFMFDGKKIDEDRVKHIKAALKWEEELKSIKSDLPKALKQHLVSGKIGSLKNKANQIILDVPFESTLFSIYLTFNKLTDNIVHPSFSYFNNRTQAVIPGNMLPDQLYVTQPTEFVVIGRRSKSQKAVFTVQGNFQQMEYQIKCLQAEDQAQKQNFKPDYLKWLKIILLGLSLYGLYSLIGKFFSGSPTPEPSEV